MLPDLKRISCHNAVRKISGTQRVRIMREGQVLEVQQRWNDPRSSIAASDSLKRRIMFITATRTAKGADETCEGRDG